ncbi:PREDICTED: aspartic proteinase CDR1-like [Ipomoea nil]|uniref:aspartic proteinase CDR1-like n=1 Tax=Ipomoea nil TaxID=35883 RepID=UPI0009017B5B|nr:PREDICTED: aspartic proteinase CDR1-like [Ipomoea nil]
MKRSELRGRNLGSRASLSSTIVASNVSGEYLMKVAIGTPPVDALVIADTGSDLIWIQCEPCKSCFDQPAPVFDPAKSSTFRHVPCQSPDCHGSADTTCDETSNTCEYRVAYGDKSRSSGWLARESLTLGASKTAAQEIVFGCGFENQGTYGEGSGMLGLGGGNLSLISQLRPSIAGKFSYCLVPMTKPGVPSKINFGDSAVVSGAGAVSTPLAATPDKTFYYVTLEGISVGKTRIKFNDSSNAEFFNKEGNIIVDSGTTLTYLPGDVYAAVESAVRLEINTATIADPPGVLNLCYDAASLPPEKIPSITLHFRGADLTLESTNTFVPTSDVSLCFGFSEDGINQPILGNIAQMNFLVGYDLEKMTVSFKPTDCSSDGSSVQTKTIIILLIFLNFIFYMS